MMKDQKDNMIEVEFDKYFNSPEYKSNEILERAYETPSKIVAKRIAKKALEVYPDNIDAEALIVNFEENSIKKLKKLDELIQKATKLLEKDNMFDKENIGIFWGILETRPYMRVRYSKILTLILLGRYTEAIKECEDMLTLCEGDNMGIRYIALGLYCVLEKFEECEKLYSRYSDDSLMMVFPMAIMYYKKGDYKKAKRYLRLAEDRNEFIISFLVGEDIENLREYKNDYYSFGSEEEAFMTIESLMYLISSVPSFIEFIITEYIK